MIWAALSARYLVNFSRSFLSCMLSCTDIVPQPPRLQTRDHRCYPNARERRVCRGIVTEQHRVLDTCNHVSLSLCHVRSWVLTRGRRAADAPGAPRTDSGIRRWIWTHARHASSKSSPIESAWSRRATGRRVTDPLAGPRNVHVGLTSWKWCSAGNESRWRRNDEEDLGDRSSFAGTRRVGNADEGFPRFSPVAVRRKSIGKRACRRRERCPYERVGYRDRPRVLFSASTTDSAAVSVLRERRRSLIDTDVLTSRRSWSSRKLSSRGKRMERAYADVLFWFSPPRKG